MLRVNTSAKEKRKMRLFNKPYDASYFYMGNAYELLGEQENACRYWKKAVELGEKQAQSTIDEKCKS